MKTSSFVFCAVSGLALLVTGCQSSGTTARIQEKSAEFSALQVWQKNFIQKGVVATGFSPDMVYMAVGKPSKAEKVKISGDGVGELWTYNNFYPAPDATRMGSAPFTTESVYQPSGFISNPLTITTEYDDPGEIYVNNPGQTNTPRGMGRTDQSIFVTGGPQGGSMEPADLEAFTLQILFQDGKVTRLAMKHT